MNSAEVRSSASLAGSGICPYPGAAPGGGPLRAERGGLVSLGRWPVSPARRAALLAELGEDCTAQLWMTFPVSEPGGGVVSTRTVWTTSTFATAAHGTR